MLILCPTWSSPSITPIFYQQGKQGSLGIPAASSSSIFAPLAAAQSITAPPSQQPTRDQKHPCDLFLSFPNTHLPPAAVSVLVDAT